MDYMKEYQKWLTSGVLTADEVAELEAIKGNDRVIESRCYGPLEFGTAGLRGVMAAGTARMNVYTVRKASQGLANYLVKNFENPSCAIAYDSRIKSDVFAKEAAKVLAANGITVHIYKELMPTPMLSWAVRYLKCDAGIVVTASHNPAKYNGYKVYGNDGCQITLNAAEEILGYISEIDCFDDVKVTLEEIRDNVKTNNNVENNNLDEEIKNNDNIIYEELIGKKGYYFALEFNYEKCTGCGICIKPDDYKLLSKKMSYLITL